jgi:hypothetical protein
MALVNCVRCGNVFNSSKDQVTCPSCVLEENKELKKITEYLIRNPLATVLDVNLNTGVAQQMIFRFINSGSLKIKSGETKPIKSAKHVKHPYK